VEADPVKSGIPVLPSGRRIFLAVFLSLAFEGVWVDRSCVLRDLNARDSAVHARSSYNFMLPSASEDLHLGIRCT